VKFIVLGSEALNFDSLEQDEATRKISRISVLFLKKAVSPKDKKLTEGQNKISL